ncbi:ABC transporter permease subunit [Actinoplanes sp. GCM10030250]|uniref:ABC transporter permease subunit n=1 Tax=Actinoplanes sp. GCM10030250 TaxID=3273376 RepID=UPI00360F2E0C
MRVSFARVVHAEWGKLAALRSTWVVFVVAALITAGLAGVINWNVYRQPGAEVSAGTLVAQAFLGVDVISIILGVFGILLITGEYGSGLIRATFAAVPRRTPVLWAKALALTAAAIPVMVVVCAASLAVAMLFVPGGQRLGFGDLPAHALPGAAAAPVALALIGLGFGALLRHTAAAITVYVLVMLVLPALIQPALPQSVADDVLRYVPIAAAQAMYSVEGGNPFQMLGPGPAALTTAGWVLLALGAGAVVVRRRDP